MNLKTYILILALSTLNSCSKAQEKPPEPAATPSQQPEPKPMKEDDIAAPRTSAEMRKMIDSMTSMVDQFGAAAKAQKEATSASDGISMMAQAMSLQVNAAKNSIIGLALAEEIYAEGAKSDRSKLLLAQMYREASLSLLVASSFMKVKSTWVSAMSNALEEGKGTLASVYKQVTVRYAELAPAVKPLPAIPW